MRWDFTASASMETQPGEENKRTQHPHHSISDCERILTENGGRKADTSVCLTEKKEYFNSILP